MRQSVEVRGYVSIPLFPLTGSQPQAPPPAKCTALGDRSVALEVEAMEGGRLTRVKHVLIGAEGPATFVRLSDTGDAVVARVTTNVREEARARGLTALPATITATLLDADKKALARGAMTCTLVAKSGQRDKPRADLRVMSASLASPGAPSKRRLGKPGRLDARSATKRLFR